VTEVEPVVRRVVLIGAESTGKTTVAPLLAERYATSWVPEYGREYWERKLAGRPLDGPQAKWTSDEFVAIATEQQRRENEAALGAAGMLVCDTNAFATGTWHERYLGRRSESVDAIGRRDRVDLYLLTFPDFPFVQDGWRDGESIREWMHGRFAEQLAALPTPVVPLRGPLARRLADASAAIDALLTPHR
jgi:HTH-type transcriptional regulator, transcriptional repressor of NAD biosynthesis genes